MNNQVNETMILFENFSEESRNFWVFIYLKVRCIRFYADFVSFTICFVGFFANIVHLIILSQKSMRNLSVNVFFIGIAICDTIRLLLIIISFIIYFYYIFQASFIHEKCTSPTSHSMLLLAVLSSSIRNLLKISMWFASIMGVFRALFIRYPFNKIVISLMTIKNSIRTSILITLLILPFWYTSFIKIRENPKWIWKPPSDCPGFSKNFTQIVYIVEKIVILVDVIVFKLLPSIILTITAILLTFQLKKQKIRSIPVWNQQSKIQTTRTTKLVIIETVMFLIPTLIKGTLYLSRFFVYKCVGLTDIIDNLAIIFTLLTNINGSIHLLICYLMATNYRNAAKQLFRWKGNKKNTILIQYIKHFQK
ncbi:G-protein coupled receptors family 1 profile domain-containing protein [Caenorhabditis elegans]|uniref:G-protein coupled receptors family 1 profile domain-containing protein n=1 Tax=Caenorhabditis elegans TaxID=6239 RepID=Q9N3H7_CAEEL|nr:G-protein coupled receptors family 1 profile domain-containing protein [Caenorhabditis elegans]CCD62415.1 G-protein coupled receptors family 1 profile domain-containing protein [Caenorhabditis elegans]|eukprot:NP_494759.2 Serpentine Receptor, class W [Caenorhabditis elegans]